MRAVPLVLLAACGRFGFDTRATGDATSGDTAAEDSSRDASSDGANLCGLYCDGFEGVMLDPRWMVDTSQGTLTLDSTHVHSGASAVHIHTNQIGGSTTNPRASLLGYDALPVTGTIYVRAWAYFASPQPTGYFEQIINLADLPGNGISMGAKAGKMANNDYTPPTSYVESTTETLPLDTWTCLMFEMPSGVTGTSRVYVGGTELTDLAIPVTSAQPAPTHVYIGIEWVGNVNNQAPADAWLDDVAVDTQPLACM